MTRTEARVWLLAYIAEQPPKGSMEDALIDLVLAARREAVRECATWLDELGFIEAQLRLRGLQ